MTTSDHADLIRIEPLRRAFAWAAERVTSWRRERRILRLCREACRFQRDGAMFDARIAFKRMSLEIEARTPQQVTRMERARRLEARGQG